MKQYVINFDIQNHDTFLIVYKKLHSNLCSSKNKIDKFSNWEHFKKVCNIYENIYTNNKKYNICLKTPTSRSYFKLCEILIDCNIKNVYDDILCLAEAPGGFVEYICENKLIKNYIYANSLISKNNIPQWNFKFLKKYNNKIKYLHSTSNNGDITNIKNIEDVEKNHIKYDLITADGGVDYTHDYNNQELDSYNLIYSEIYSALLLQKPDGVFIIKIFDIFYNITIQLIYILKLCYKEVSFIKPLTSRQTNSEKYIVCKGYKKNQLIINLMKIFWENKKDIYIFIPNEFYKIIYEYNFKFVNNQIDCIENTLNKNFDENLKKKKCIEWCIKYNMPFKNN